MKSTHKIVARTPISQLWDDEGVVSTRKLKSMKRSDVEELLQKSQVHFVVINIGFKPQWVITENCYDFWKNEAKPNLCDDECALEDFPNGYMYFASEWESTIGHPIVVLTMYH
jgi:hypothetical protein